MVINVLDKEVNDYYAANLKKKVDGVSLYVLSKDDKILFNGIVWPNDQYEYRADTGGEYKICVSFTNSMFGPGIS